MIWRSVKNKFDENSEKKNENTPNPGGVAFSREFYFKDIKRFIDFLPDLRKIDH